jgi:hypothetical protein
MNQSQQSGPRRQTASGRRHDFPPGIARPDRGRIRAVRWLAALLAVVVLFSLVPVWLGRHWDLGIAPGWARAVVLLAGFQAVYIAWMLAAPDWASVWVVMLLFAVVAAVYGMVVAFAIATPPSKPMPLGLEEVRSSMRNWSAAALAVMSLATYLCGRISAKWRRAAG